MASHAEAALAPGDAMMTIEVELADGGRDWSGGIADWSEARAGNGARHGLPRRHPQLSGPGPACRAH